MSQKRWRAHLAHRQSRSFNSLSIHLGHLPFLCNYEQAPQRNWKSLHSLKRHKVAAGVPGDNSPFLLVNIQPLLGDVMPALEISRGLSSCPSFEFFFSFWNHLRNWEAEQIVTLRSNSSLMFQTGWRTSPHASSYCSAVGRKEVLVAFQKYDCAVDIYSSTWDLANWNLIKKTGSSDTLVPRSPCSI